MRIKDKQPMKVLASELMLGDFIPARGVVTEAIPFYQHILLTLHWLNGESYGVISNLKPMLIRR